MLHSFQVLIAAGADVDLQYQLDNDLWDTALHIAAYHTHLSAGFHVAPLSVPSKIIYVTNKANISVFTPTFVSVKLLVASGASLTVTKFRMGRPKDTAVSFLIFFLPYFLFLN